MTDNSASTKLKMQAGRLMVYLYFAFWFSFLERYNEMTGEEKGGEEKSTSASKQTGIDSLMHTGSLAASSLAMFSLFSYYQAYGREDYRHWGRTGVGVPVQDSLQPGSDL